MASIGMIVLDATVGSIGTTFLSGILHEDTAADAGSNHGALPSSGIIGTLEIVWNEAGGTATAIEVFVSWDAAGNEIFLPYTSLTVDTDTVDGVGDTSLIMTSIRYDRPFRVSDKQTAAGRLYLWSRNTGGTLTLTSARLTWYTPSLRT